jgi:transcriptional regulator with XRE-family HTH domain
VTSPSEELESAERIDALLARLRRERGLSQVRFAERLCAASGMHTLSRHEVSRWERGERVPSDRWLPWLATVLDVEPGVLRIAAHRSRGGVPGWTMIEPGVWWTLLPENWIILGR